MDLSQLVKIELRFEQSLTSKKSDSMKLQDVSKSIFGSKRQEQKKSFSPGVSKGKSFKSRSRGSSFKSRSSVGSYQKSVSSDNSKPLCSE